LHPRSIAEEKAPRNRKNILFLDISFGLILTPTVPKSIFSERQEVLQELLRRVRVDAGFTQTELAEKLQRPQSFVSKIESGERLLDILELKEICDVVGITLQEFVTRFERDIS
jgi:ribosome-binding protein aMBF1 (putative translation factor)